MDPTSKPRVFRAPRGFTSEPDISSVFSGLSISTEGGYVAGAGGGGGWVEAEDSPVRVRRKKVAEAAEAEAERQRLVTLARGREEKERKDLAEKEKAAVALALAKSARPATSSRTPDQSVGRRIYESANNGNVSLLTALLDEWHGNEIVNWELPEAKGKTALYVACKRGHTACVAALLNQPLIDIYKGPKTMLLGVKTPLSVAANEEIKLLLQKAVEKLIDAAAEEARWCADEARARAAAGRRNAEDNRYGSSKQTLLCQTRLGNEFEYAGEAVNGKPHGSGVSAFTGAFSGVVYEGDFVSGWREGKGVQQHPDADVYEGEWKEDKREGRGVNRWSDGRVYEGDWKNGMPHGHGVERDSAGNVTHKGRWENDVFKG